MRALKFVRNLVTRCVALLAIIVPVSKAAGQTPHTEGENRTPKFCSASQILACDRI